MSGDVQPRKRKDKKRKKDELGVEEPRGTAAVLGEGDVFMHSQHDHGTGGHWCAKIIFFSLLAVLVTLIGLIILENRGLTDLEANSVESRYSGVLEGWLEDAPDDDHHDEHTLELLKQHDDDNDDDDDDHDQEHDISQEDDHDEHAEDDDEHDDHEDDEVDDDDDGDHDEDEDEQEASNEDDNEASNEDDNEASNEDEQEASNEDEEKEQQDDDDDDDDVQDQHEVDDSEEQRLEEDDEDNNDDDDEHIYQNNESGEDDDDDDDLQRIDENETAEEDDDDSNTQNYQADDHSVENNDDDDDNENSNENENNEEHEEHVEEEGDSEIEVEKLEKEVSDEDVLSEVQPTQETEEEDDKSEEVSAEAPLEEVNDAADEADSVEDEEFLEADDIDDPLPVVERIVAPKGKPLAEVEDEPTTEKPADTLAEEEEYEKQQEELRREEAQASHVWLKLAVGGALLVATHAVVSRAVAPRDDTPASEGHTSREDTPSAIDRRMTLIPEEAATPAPRRELVEDIVRPIVEEKVSPIIQSVPQSRKEESEEEELEEEEKLVIETKDVTAAQPAGKQDTKDKELYSDEEEAEEAEEEEEEEIVEKKKETPVQAAPVPVKDIEPETEEPEEEDVPDDVEIIDDEQLEEELEEEEDEDEEEISDVDDAELLSRLEAKYGRLPEPDRPEPKHKDGGNSIEADWPGEPSDKYWRQQLDEAEQELRQGEWRAASARTSAPALAGSLRARWLRARALDAAAEAQRDNGLLARAIAAYLDVLKLNERLSDARLREVADRTLDRIRFRGNYMSAEPVYRLLIRRFPDVVDYRNNMTVSLLMANRADLAEEVIKETLRKWPDDRFALAHLGFILKTQHNRLEEAVEAFQKALEGDTGPATEPRFYYHLGDSLLLLGRFAEAHEVHKRGAKLGHFLSPAQRSLYNVDRLKSRPWWDIQQTPYLKLARALEKSWKDILNEGQAAQALYEKEKEGLKERGEWSQLDLFVRGQEVPGRCKKAPVTCSIVKTEAAAAGCRRGQIKFSSMEAGTHVRPHVGPTNCRLRMHLGLSNTKDTYIRVDQETRQWQVGKVFMFDDSFEHEVWHNGTGTRLVLIVDVWHPALTAAERRTLPPI